MLLCAVQQYPGVTVHAGDVVEHCKQVKGLCNVLEVPSDCLCRAVAGQTEQAKSLWSIKPDWSLM